MSTSEVLPGAPAPEARRDAQAAERREQLLDAAVRLVRRDGPAVSMDQLAAEAGITKPILYRHFGDRAGLVHALASRFALDLVDRLLNAMASSQDPREILEAAIDAYLRLVEEDTQVYRFLVHSALPERPDGHVVLTGFIHAVATAVGDVLERQLEAVGADTSSSRAWAFGMVGMVHLAGDWWLTEPTMARGELVENLVTLLWSGLAGSGLVSPRRRPAGQV